MEKAVKLKEKRKETKKKWNAVGQKVAIAKHLQKHIDGNEEMAISSNKPTKHDSWLEPEKESNTKQSIFKKIVEAIGFLGFLLITINETYVCFERYSDYPKYTSNQFLKQSEVDFPSFTFCNNVHYGYKLDLLRVSFIVSSFSFP